MSDSDPVEEDEKGSMVSCSVCGRRFFESDEESEMGEPKICSQKCADESSGVAA